MLAEYRTVSQKAEDEFVEKRSRFIGYISPVSTQEEALAFIDSIRRRHWDAKHNVSAYSLREGGVCRCSDDGEPSGTAGMPVLSVLTKSGITDAVIVVTRYFGGILLGAGGLVRAYSHAASLALAAGKPVIMRECVCAYAECSYAQYGRVAALVPECSGVVDLVEYTDVTRVSFHIAEEDIPSLEKKLADATCGEVSIVREGSQFYQFELE